MSDPIDHGSAERHTLQDWLDLHSLDRQTCLGVVDAIGREARETPGRQSTPDHRYQALDTDGTWALAIAAMRDFLPQHHDLIDDTFANSKKIAIVGGEKSRRAVTIDHGPSQYPTIMFHLNSDASDPLIVAHEFGHALQIRASGGTFVPPIMREMCAFLAERALLSYSLANDANRYDALLERWRKDSEKYLGLLSKKLKSDLDTDDAIYDYGWNYPIARLFADRLSTEMNPQSVWGAFMGEWSVQSVLNKLDI